MIKNGGRSPFLEQTLSKLNGNKKAIMNGVKALGMMAQQGAPDMLPAAESVFERNMNPQGLINANRRQKGSTAIGTLKSGAILYSDGTIRQEETDIGDEGIQRGFGNLQMPSYEDEVNTQGFTAPSTESPTDSITEKFLSPFEKPELEETPEDNFPEEAAASPYETFMQNAGKIPEELRKEIDEFLATPEDKQRGSSQGKEGQFSNPDQKIIASKAPARYNIRSVPSSSSIRGLPSFRGTSLQDLVSQFEKEEY